MKKNIHPEYRPVLFHDLSVDAFFLIGSTIKTSRTYPWTDGKTYPYIALDVSSESHPFYTGKQKVTQTEGRVAAFSKKFGQLAARNHRSS
jgi:large subunit ribosomal protein L31